MRLLNAKRITYSEKEPQQELHDGSVWHPQEVRHEPQEPLDKWPIQPVDRFPQLTHPRGR